MIIVFIHAMLFLKVIDMSGFLPHDILAVPPDYQVIISLLRHVSGTWYVDVYGRGHSVGD